MAPSLLTPAYGRASLADLLPSVLASLGVDDEPDSLGLPATCRAVVLLVDGLGPSCCATTPRRPPRSGRW